MINRFALSFLCIELDRNVRFGVTLLYILLTTKATCVSQLLSRARHLFIVVANRLTTPEASEGLASRTGH